MTDISHRSIIEAGRYTGVSLKGINPEFVVDLYRFMQRLRRCELALIEEYHPADQMRCPVHFCVGQEAAPAALSLLLSQDDYLFSHHRSHGYFLAKGVPMKALFSEIYGRATGANGGIAGSQDISMPSANFYSGAILSGAVAMAGGAALSMQLKQRRQVVVSGFGEAASDEGIFWEAMNYAALRKLPVVFVCENNLYATYSHMLKRHPIDNIHERVASFGVESKALFGNDVIASHRAIAEAIDRAKDGGGPSFIELYTYRWNGHVGPEDDDYKQYRPKEEIEFWKANCPIALLEEAMLADGVLNAETKANMIAEIDREIDEAFRFAKASPFPQPKSWDSLNRSEASPWADQLLYDTEMGKFDESQDEAIPRPY